MSETRDLHPQEDPSYRGTEEVAMYRGFSIYRAVRGTFGFGVGMNLDNRGCYCPYGSVDGAINALVALIRLHPEVRPAFDALREKPDE
jgi:hypothetical protein